MKFSLDMLQYELEKKSISCEIRCRRHQYFQRFQLFHAEETALSQECLYIITQNIHADPITPGQKQPFTILYLYKPIFHPAHDYAYISEPVSADYLLNALIETTDSFHAFKYAVLDMLVRQNNIQDFINQISEKMDNPSYIVDSSFQVLAIQQADEIPLISATFKHLVERRYVPIHTVVSLLNSDSWTHTAPSDLVSLQHIPQFYRPFIKFDIRFENRLQGFFFIVAINHEIHPGELDYLRILEPYITKFFYRNMKSLSSKGNYYEYFFKDVILGNLKDTRSIEEQLVPIHWKPDDTFSVLVCPVDLENEIINQTIFSRLMHIDDGKPVIIEEKLYCVYRIPDHEEWNNLTRQLDKLFNQCRRHAGISEPFSGFYNLNQYVYQAESALSLGTGKHPSQYFYLFQNYRMQHLIDICSKHMNLNMLCPMGLLKLELYDLRNDTQYSNTLYHYLKNERNVTLTSQQLHLHRNSLLYRINRINEITAFNLDDADLRFQLLLAFEIKKHS